MAQIEKVEIQTEIKSSDEKFHQIFQSKSHLLPRIFPHVIKDIQVLEGDWESLCSVKKWYYFAGN